VCIFNLNRFWLRLVFIVSVVYFYRQKLIFHSSLLWKNVFYRQQQRLKTKTVFYEYIMIYTEKIYLYASRKITSHDISYFNLIFVFRKLKNCFSLYIVVIKHRSHTLTHNNIIMTFTYNIIINSPSSPPPLRGSFLPLCTKHIIL